MDPTQLAATLGNAFTPAILGEAKKLLAAQPTSPLTLLMRDKDGIIISAGVALIVVHNDIGGEQKLPNWKNLYLNMLDRRGEPFAKEKLLELVPAGNKRDAVSQLMRFAESVRVAKERKQAVDELLAAAIKIAEAKVSQKS